jgi:hypothetical protein
MSAFFILCFVLSVMQGKIEQCICLKLSMKLSKPDEMLCQGFDEQVECQLKMMNVQGDQAPTK